MLQNEQQNELSQDFTNIELENGLETLNKNSVAGPDELSIL